MITIGVTSVGSGVGQSVLRSLAARSPAMPLTDAVRELVEAAL